ncbi:MAG: hypothetical protein R3B96_08795 [Pirellulaceae bacterium]
MRRDKVGIEFRDPDRSMGRDGNRVSFDPRLHRSFQAERVDPFPLPRWSTAYSTLDAIPNLKGDSQYMLVNRPEGVELRDQETRERMFVPVASFANALDPALGNPLMSDSRALEKLGVPLGDTVSIFDDALRVQLFRGGVLVMESAQSVLVVEPQARPE